MKRKNDHEYNGSSGSDEEIGPVPAGTGNTETPPVNETHNVEKIQSKKRKLLANKKSLLEELPTTKMYEKSYMHRIALYNTQVTPKTDFLLSTSKDGCIKFWKKMPQGLEFIKQFKAHMKGITGTSYNIDGTKYCTISDDCSIKLYDILTFDMTNIIQLPYVPLSISWVCYKGRNNLAISDKDNNIFIIDSDGKGDVLHTILNHNSPVIIMSPNFNFNTIISADIAGNIEYWSTNSYTFPKDIVNFNYKLDTDLYTLYKLKVKPLSISCNNKGTQFALYSNDGKIRVFDFLNGNLLHIYNESISFYDKLYESKQLTMDNMEYKHRIQLEEEVLKLSPTDVCNNCVFDLSDNFLIFSCLLGIKIVNLVENKTECILGQVENQRFLGLSLFQGIAKRDTQIILDNINNNTNPTNQNDPPAIDPTIFCTSLKKSRFYCFSKREPFNNLNSSSNDDYDRDVYNEKPTDDDLLVPNIKTNSNNNNSNKRTCTKAIIHTTLGDMEFELFPNKTPRTNENFTVHAKSGYYDNLIFHRVIKGFMIQGGDPTGTGNGGESIWGDYFEDEFHQDLTHNTVGTLSMANKGPCTNTSQFFITCITTPWLDNKHTVFGKIKFGENVLRLIENVRCNNKNRPLEDVKILNIDTF